jgi:hypothetical protein
MSGWVAGAIAVSSVVGASASKSAAKTQAGAADRAAELQREQFERQVELQAPFREAGVRALPELEAASRYTMFGPEQFSKDPGYGFRLAEGQKALERNAAARGGLISGGALKAAQRFGQEMGSQEYTNAFNRYQIERNARLAPLQSLAGFGQTSVNQLGQAGQNYATNAGNLMTGGAAAQAAGQVGAANAFTGGLGTYMNYSQNQAQNSLLQQALQNRGGGLSNADIAEKYNLNS